MIIRFKNIVIHNFLSYSHSEITLEHRDFCSIKGINLNPDDKQKSNGAGKSTIFNALCFALTGQMINGVKSGLKNKNIEEKSCYVTLTFDVDNDSYVITRYVEPKSDMKIIKNGQDISGKGIRESQMVLSSELPDLTYNLISSTILIGQGMPNKLSSFTPAGRKELLEQLSKSDFMIEDIKNRIGQESDRLYAKSKANETSKANIQGQLQVYNSNLKNHKSQLEVLNTPRDFDSELNDLNNLVEINTNSLNALNNQITECSSNINNYNTELLNLNDALNKEKLNVTNDFTQRLLDINESKTHLDSEIQHLNKEINNIKNIQDVCPLCHQKIQGVEKPDVQPFVDEYNKKLVEFNEIKKQINSIENEKQEQIRAITLKYSTSINELQIKKNEATMLVNNLNTQVSTINSTINSLKNNINNVTNEKNNFTNQINLLTETINNEEQEIVKLNEQIVQLNTDYDAIKVRLDVIKKFESLVKRDFRGYLLENVIAYINKKAKEYCSIIFGTNNLEFKQDGTNLAITYSDKDFDNLSGGEKQKVDLVLQFALRDMMSTYLGFSSNILVCDEIFDNLDSLVTSNVLDLITNNLNDIESLFIISHHTDLDIPYDNEIVVTKGVDDISEAH